MSQITDQLTFHLIPHTHWDREWYLSRAAFQARLIPMLDGVLSRLEQDATARFVLDGQTVLLEDYLAVQPEHAARIAPFVERSALEIGPWYVLSDLLIPSGESLIRNLLEGSADAAHLGRRLDVLYSPDAFGHPGALPALAAEFGIAHAVIRRGLGRPGGQDRDFYRWESPSGASVLVYHLPSGGYDVALEAVEAESELSARWPQVRRELVARAATDQIAVFLGADHQPPPSDLAGVRSRLRALESGHRVRVSGLTDFFAVAKPNLGSIPTIRGELRRGDGHTWMLQGVHSARARQKRHHSRAELFLARTAAPLAAMTQARGGPDRRGLLRLTWRTLLQSQFHDTLAGSCGDPVAREQEVRLDSVDAVSREVATRSLWELAGYDPDRSRGIPDQACPKLLLWNPCARPRSGIMTAEISAFRRDVLIGFPGGRTPRKGKGFRPFNLCSSSGEDVPVQLLGVRPGQERVDADRHYPDQDEVDRVFVAFRPPPVPGLGILSLTPVDWQREPPGEGLEVGEGVLANRYLRVTLSPTGSITLEDRTSGERYAGLGGLEDEPERGDSYTASRGHGGSGRVEGKGTRSIVARGPLIGAVEARWSLRSAGRGEVGVRLLTVLHADDNLVRLRFDVDNGATDHRLRACFPVGAGGAALAGAAFGYERRVPVLPSNGNDAIEREAPTAPAQRFVAVADGQRGLAVFAPGFFEYEWTEGRELKVTLLRTFGELSRSGLPERPGHAAWPQETPLAQELGPHTIELAIGPINSGHLERADRLERSWEEAFLSPRAVFLRNAGAGDSAAGGSAVELEGEDLVFSAVKPAATGDGLVLRCYNTANEAREGRWLFSPPVRAAVRVRADETAPQEICPRKNGREVWFKAGPREIVSIIVTTETPPDA